MKREYIVVLRVLLCLLVCTAVTGVFSLRGTLFFQPIETAIAASGSNAMGASLQSGSAVQLRFQDTPPPIAVAEQLPTESDDPRVVVLSAEGSTVADEMVTLEATIATYEWNFGDGSGWVTAVLNVGDPLWLAYHTYEDYGVYQARLLVTDSFGMSKETILEVQALRLVDGQTGESAQGNLVKLPFPPASVEDYVFEEGLCISFREMIVRFKDSATVLQVNNLLQGNGASITGSDPTTGIVLVRKNAGSLSELFSTVAAFNASGLVDFAFSEMGGSAQSLPPYHEDTIEKGWTWTVPDYLDNDPPADGGNWGLELIRAPQMWNLDSWVRRNRSHSIAAGIAEPAICGTQEDLPPIACADPQCVVDDCPHYLCPQGEVTDEEAEDLKHGTMIAGIMGAKYLNAQGVEGVCPWLDRIYLTERVFEMEDADVGTTPELDQFEAEYEYSTWGRQLQYLTKLLERDEAIRVIGNSYGMSKYFSYCELDPEKAEFGTCNKAGTTSHSWPPIDADSSGQPDTWREILDRWGKLYKEVIDRAAVSETERNNSRKGLFFVIGSAGNYDEDKYDGEGELATPSAVTNSPICNAAINYKDEPSNRFLAVEAIGIDRCRATKSSVEGSVSAPGESVMSTSFTEDEPNCYETGSGTSYAVPFVAGLICSLWTLDPTLTIDEVRELIVGADYTQASYDASASCIDAFAAAMGIDRVKPGNNKAMQRALVDVDDGTRDGNLRKEVVSSDIVPLEPLDQGRPGQRGDYCITMRDFRVLRDAYLQLHEDELAIDGIHVQLDSNAHQSKLKMDLNLDRSLQLYSTDNEALFPRCDFNGDGKLDNTMAMFNGQMKTDAEVLADPDIWSNAERGNSYWENVTAEFAEEGILEKRSWQPLRYLLANRDLDDSNTPEVLRQLPDYIHSCDLHLLIQWPSSSARLVSITVESAMWRDGAGEEGDMEADFDDPANVFVRTGEFSRGAPNPLIVTIPLWTGAVRVSWKYYDSEFGRPYAGGGIPSLHANFGQDVLIDVVPAS